MDPNNPYLKFISKFGAPQQQQSPQQQPQGPFQQSQQQMQQSMQAGNQIGGMFKKGASYLMGKQPQAQPPAMGQPGTAPQPTMQQLTGAGGASSQCPTCGAPMNSSDTSEEMGIMPDAS